MEPKPPEDDQQSPDTTDAFEEMALEADSEETPQAQTPEDEPRGPGKVKRFFKAWWNRKWLRYTTLVTLLLVTGVFIFLPSYRYSALNLLGVRGTVDVTIVDNRTKQPLKDVLVAIGGQTATTDSNGQAEITEAKLGSQVLTASKTAYEESTRDLTVSVGSTALTDVSLNPTGTTYSFKVTDWLTDKPISKVEASYQDSSAFSNEEGVVELTVPPTSDAELTVKLTGDGYRETETKVQANSRDTNTVKLVPDDRHAFVSRRSGVYDVYVSDLDGKNEKKILDGTGKEREGLLLSVNYELNKALLVSTRDGIRNSQNQLMDGLFVLDLGNGDLSKVDEGYRIQLVGWIDDTMVYTKNSYLAKQNQQYQLRVHSVNSADTKTIETAGSFNDILVANSSIFYIPSTVGNTKIKPHLYISSIEGDKRTVIAKESWSVLRQAGDRIIVNTANNVWYEADINGDNVTKLDGPPARAHRSLSRLYITSHSGENSLWVDQRDGKGVLLLHKNGTADEADKILTRQSGLRSPVRWLDDSTVVYRVVTDSETADYVLSLDGGSAKKISDVTDVGSEDRYYYYY